MPSTFEGWKDDWLGLIPKFKEMMGAEGAWYGEHHQRVLARGERIRAFVTDSRIWSMGELITLLEDTDAKYGYRQSIQNTLLENGAGTSEGMENLQARWRSLYKWAGEEDRYLTPEGFAEILGVFRNIGIAFHSEFLSNLYPNRFWQLNGIVERFAAGADFRWPPKSSKAEHRYFAIKPLLECVRKNLQGQGIEADYRVADHFLYWAVEVEQYGGRAKRQYWKIAPGEKAWEWDACKAEGYIALGWSEIGDLSKLDRRTFEQAWQEMQTKDSEFGEGGREQLWKFFSKVKPGDRILANRGKTEILGVGTIAGPYYFAPGQKQAHRRKVTWEDRPPWKADEPGWGKALIELSEEKYEKLLKGAAPPLPVPDPAIPRQGFELLQGLAAEPTKAFYDAHLEEFNDHLLQPFRELLKGVADTLPQPMKEVLETEKRLFSKIPKNDYGRGGAWDFYWGAFYPKGGSRIKDGQLFVTVKADSLKVGFAVSDYGESSKERLRANCTRHSQKLLALLNDSLGNSEGLMETSKESQPAEGSSAFRLKEWMEDPRAAEKVIALVLEREVVLSLSKTELVNTIAEIFKKLFPLLLLTMEGDALDRIVEFLKPEIDEPELQPVYTLEEAASETGLPQATLARWVRAIRRKGQAVLFGPPGTGKTFLAERLARHLIGGSDGFWDLVQFHPSYSYEDFIQGIRPRALAGGGLEYPMVPGRFLEFCAKAKACTGPCVLVVDEINRANLSRVFGELMFLLEYRDQDVPLAGGERLSLPKNVFLLGTMNTADRSIALVDHALRRRFAFLKLEPNYDVLAGFHASTGFAPAGLVTKLRELNQAIADPNYSVGISFFLRQDLADHLEDIWRMEIEPYLEEYFFDQPDKVSPFRWEAIKHKVQP